MMISRVAIPLLLLCSTLATADTSPAANTSPTARKSIELIIDASGSMNAKMPGGASRLQAAKRAVARLVKEIDPSLRISFRAYGHQSDRREKNCKDTQLLVDFANAGQLRDAIIAKSNALPARGYTPITWVIGLAADDLKKESQAEQRVIILVSDGKETCAGDPCATAKKIAEADAKLVIHTVGLAVADAARFQLKCIASVGRGTYTDAGTPDELVNSLKTASGAAPPSEQVIKISKPKPGKLQIKGADMFGHRVSDAVTGREVAKLSNLKSITALPAGVYNVTFGKAVWKSVAITGGKTTVLEPALLQVKNASMRGHSVLDSETGEEIAKLSNLKSTATLIPSVVDVTFGQAIWRGIKLSSGNKTVLNPGIVKVSSLGMGSPSVKVRDAAGKVVGSLSNLLSTLPLPPGSYELTLADQKVPFTLKEGKTVNIKLE